jgi:hypothetical protein
MAFVSETERGFLEILPLGLESPSADLTHRVKHDASIVCLKRHQGPSKAGAIFARGAGRLARRPYQSQKSSTTSIWFSLKGWCLPVLLCEYSACSAMFTAFIVPT